MYQQDKSVLSVDLLVIGGGINGTGVARDAAGRGLSVALCEQDDLAQYTSSSSTKLIHGGLRYLEHYDFKLVRHSLREREVLLRSAPHIIWPMRFILPHHRALRPRWLIRLGLFLYDHLGKRILLPGSNGVDLRKHVSGGVLKPEFTHGFEYSDCWVQDARMVVLNAMDAKERGAVVMTRTRCAGLLRNQDQWEATLELRESSELIKVHARAIVNAAGPWVEQVAGLDPGSQSAHGIRLVKGSHIIVPSLFEHNYAYIFQNKDDRILFAIPYESDFTLLGTTDVEIESDPAQVTVSDEEIDYLCHSANQYFARELTPDDVVAKYAGVRPLFDDAKANASKTTRDYVLHIDNEGPPLVSIYGGKLTTFRRLSEEVMDMLANPLRADSGAWTTTGVLPGGDFDAADYAGFEAECKSRYPWCDKFLVTRLARNYGTRIDHILSRARSMNELGQHFGAGLYQAEVSYLIENELAMSAEDILVRRTKLGLHGGQSLAQSLGDWFLKEFTKKVSTIPVA
ncbi:MAG: glycerol-3-phosphate dehydrogenase [Arenicellales bacterium]